MSDSAHGEAAKQAGSAVIPSMRYKDAKAAIDWLVHVLGFERRAVYEGKGDSIEHAELTFGRGMIMLGSASNANPHAKYFGTPEETGGRVTSPMYLVVPDCGPVYAKVKAAGAQIVQELRTMDYGGQSFSVVDPEGYLWSVGEYDPWTVQGDAQGKEAA